MNVAELTRIIEDYGKDVYGFCFKLTRDKHQADDLYQETFLKATELCHKIDKAKNPKGFIIAIAANTWKNQQRKFGWRHRIAKVVEFQDDFDNEFYMIDTTTPELVAISNEAYRMIDRASASLNDKLKIPLYMYYNTGLSIEDIADALKVPTGTVKSRLYKARKLIKEYMEVNGYEGF
ncbi:RNA polymerase sigma factor [Tissierella praeacuta]|uniref:RNA polymerase sigma factor n=1 Tax=Tissierella praeacuta TaxID=43131 RepID=UPI002FDA8B7C